MLFKEPSFVVEIDTVVYPQRNDVPAVAIQGHFELSVAKSH